MCTDGQTDNTGVSKLIFAFHNFLNSPKNSTFCSHITFVAFGTNSDYVFMQLQVTAFITDVYCLYFCTVHSVDYLINKPAHELIYNIKEV